MNRSILPFAVASLAGLAIAQTPAATEDTEARNQAKAAATKAASAESRAIGADAKADSSLRQNKVEEEKLQATEGKLDGLNESYLETKATVAALAKLKVGGFLQYQYAFASDTNQSGGYATKQGAWSLRRARLKFTYDAGNGAVFVWQPNFLENKFETKDAYLQYSEPWLKTFSIRAGIQDIPFGYEIGASSAGMENIERSRYEKNGLFKDEKDLGTVLTIASPLAPWVNLKAGWMNGVAPNNVQTDWSANQDPKNIVGRLGLAYDFQEAGISLEGGASYYYDNKLLTDTSKGGTYIQFRNDSMVKVTNSFRKELTSKLFGADLEATAEIPQVGGIKLVGEYYQGKDVGATGTLTRYSGVGTSAATPTTVADIRNISAFYVTAILNPFVLVKPLQLVYRFDHFDPNTDVSGDKILKAKGFGSADLAYNTNTVGLNWFVNGNLKISLFYDIVSNEKTHDPALNGHADINAGKKDANGKALAADFSGAYTAKNDFTGDVDDNILTLRGQVSF